GLRGNDQVEPACVGSAGESGARTRDQKGGRPERAGHQERARSGGGEEAVTRAGGARRRTEEERQSEGRVRRGQPEQQAQIHRVDRGREAAGDESPPRRHGDRLDGGRQTPALEVRAVRRLAALVLSAAAALAAQPPAPYDIVIRGGTIVDGSGRPRYT